MQSGRAKAAHWALEFAPAQAMTPDPLMGWTTMRDTTRQVRLAFETQQEAEAYAQKHGIAYEVLAPRPRRIKPRAYAANFAHARRMPFTPSSGA